MIVRFTTTFTRQNPTPKPITFSSTTKTLTPSPPNTNINHLKQTHANLIRSGQISNPLIVGKLVSDIALSSPSNIIYARSIFDRIAISPNTFTWNSLIRAYSRGPSPIEALRLYLHMQTLGYPPNNYTFPFALKASTESSARAAGLALHGSLIKRGFEDNDVFIQTSLIDFYGSFGFAVLARDLFDRIPDRDVTCWNALMKAYVRSDRAEEAVRAFRAMTRSRPPVRADEITALTVASACGAVGALDVGRWIHGYVGRSRLDLGVNLGTALIDMYAKCGDIDAARAVFEAVRGRGDARAWGAMIGGLAVHGFAREALGLFYDMRTVDPDSVVLTAALSACSHAGLVREGLRILYGMREAYGVEPTIEHYGCAVDLLGRAGRLSEAFELIARMPMEPDVVLWGSLLVACRVHRDVERGERVAKEMLKLDPEHAGAHVFLFNVYASAGEWARAEHVRGSMWDRRVKKPPGSSLIELGGACTDLLRGMRRTLRWVGLRR
ncbi:Pentatricopeptide repeat-containing protein [Acorus calamus]|uniref:Pentatricopeptide repeat-containing protein n=1 Tax=Acorus calamus TaxID=4465 RepID=A0AAV9C9P7_ACOCL|nr:Pentatricopeptide repeat-containing protein [Acorus calamus]